MNKRIIVILLFLTVIVLLALAAWVGLRKAEALREMVDEWTSFYADAPALATTSRLEFIPLYGAASPSPDFISGHGVSRY